MCCTWDLNLRFLILKTKYLELKPIKDITLYQLHHLRLLYFKQFSVDSYIKQAEIMHFQIYQLLHLC